MLWKPMLDRGLALLLLIPGLPLVMLLVAVVRLTSRGPGIYSQSRVGKGGRIFTMYKLRSMRIDAETNRGVETVDVLSQLALELAGAIELQESRATSLEGAIVR